MTREETIDAATEARNARHHAANDKYAAELLDARMAAAAECNAELAAADAEWRAAIAEANVEAPPPEREPRRLVG